MPSRRILRKRTIVKRSGAGYLCDSIRAGIDFFATVKQSAGILRGVEEPDNVGLSANNCSNMGACSANCDVPYGNLDHAAVNSVEAYSD